MKRIFIAAIALTLSAIALYLYRIEYFFPIASDKQLDFGLLCDMQEIETPSSALSPSIARTISLFDVWEHELLVPRKGNSRKQLFDYSQNLYRLHLQHELGTVRQLDGFVDHVDVEFFKVRFRAFAEHAGKWSFFIKNNSGEIVSSGSFEVEDNPGPVDPALALDPNNPGKLLAGGQPFHFIGGKWLAAQNYTPCQIHQHRHLRDSHHWLSDEAYIAYLDTLEETGHNALLLKMAQFPLMSDGYSWDLAWIQRGEWMLREAVARGMYVQINLFDTWSRDRLFKVLNSTSGSNHEFDVWEPVAEDLNKAKNYLRNIIARFSPYPHVMWELGNEMEHKPNCGECFVKAANEFYLPWIRELDEYNRLIGLSESVWLDTSVDMGLLHQTRTEDFAGLPNDDRPMVMNELVFSDDTPPLWRDSTIRDPESRFAFRRTFWRNLMLGTVGSFEATWLNVMKPMSEEVLLVMQDHAVLANFVTDLGSQLNKRRPIGGVEVPAGYLSYGMTINSSVYVYVMREASEDRRQIDMAVSLESVSGRYRYMNPETGQWAAWEDGMIDGSSFRLQGIDLKEDILIQIALRSEKGTL